MTSLPLKKQICMEGGYMQDKKDKCVMCECETQYNRSTSIHLRYYYIEGCGQMCTKCYKKSLS
jgi:hypothetical protein